MKCNELTVLSMQDKSKAEAAREQRCCPRPEDGLTEGDLTKGSSRYLTIRQMRHLSSFWRAKEVRNQTDFNVNSPLEVNRCDHLPQLGIQEPTTCHPVLWDL